MFSFCLTLLLIYIYKDLYKFSKNIEKNIYIQKLDKDKLNFLIYLLINVSIVNNVILYLIPRIELKIYEFFNLIK